MGSDEGTLPSHEVRIAPVPPEGWTDEAKAAIAVLPPEMAPPPGAQINVLGVLAHHPALAKAVLEFSLYLRFQSTLSDRQRELLILRTAWLRGAEYELRRHVRLARRVGLTEEELAAVAVGSGAAVWSAEEALLLRATEELCEDYLVSDATWAALADRFDAPLLMDVLFAVGTYDMFAMAYSTMGVQPEADLPVLP
jgi:AhpD family alkylhydroperoxidase